MDVGGGNGGSGGERGLAAVVTSLADATDPDAA